MRNNSKAIITSKVTDRGVMSLYLTVDDESYFLFNQNYKSSCHSFFRSGVPLDRAIAGKSSHSTSIRKTACKLIPMLVYMEKEYDFVVLAKTLKTLSKKSIGYNRSAYNRSCDYDSYSA